LTKGHHAACSGLCVTSVASLTELQAPTGIGSGNLQAGNASFDVGRLWKPPRDRAQCVRVGGLRGGGRQVCLSTSCASPSRVPVNPTHRVVWFGLLRERLCWLCVLCTVVLFTMFVEFCFYFDHF
jgi:hypothetical protein